jgi:Zn-dependent oligopeptidase
MAPLDRVSDVMTRAGARTAFMARVHPDEAVREQGVAAEERISKWASDVIFRDDLYTAVKEFSESDDGTALEYERLRFVDHWLRDFRRAGHELSTEDRSRLQGLKDRLIELQVAFQRNIDAFRDHIEVDREGLAGLPDDYVERLEAGSAPDTFQVSLDYPEYYPFMQQARRRDLRQELEYKNLSASPDNRELLEEAVAIRRQIADLFELASWADYAMEVKMAERPERVAEFYESLVPGLEKLGTPERAGIAEMLDAERPGESLRSWDFGYFDNEMRKRDFGIDQNEVAEYFPLERVIEGMLDITAEVFGVHYERIDDTNAWHPDVHLYAIRDVGTDEPGAYFYMDLFPRDGKYTHAAAFDHQKSHIVDGERVPAIAAIVANFTKPTGDQPSLLKHDEVLTLFHEFGHILHACLARAELARFSGFDTEWDFVEAPSQIMEHWCWNVDVLSRFARHYQTNQPIPPDMVNQLVAARNLNEGTATLRQVYFGKLDLGMHGPEAPVDLDRLNRKSYQVTGFPFHEGTFFPARFGHLMGGYDAGYYGYLWSKVYGDDMFSVFESEGVLNPEVGRRYRHEILEPGGSRDAADMLVSFLGREPSNEAFLRYLGLS